jgi:hypothetical protein
MGSISHLSAKSKTERRPASRVGCVLHLRTIGPSGLVMGQTVSLLWAFILQQTDEKVLNGPRVHKGATQVEAGRQLRMEGEFPIPRSLAGATRHRLKENPRGSAH